MKSMTVAVASYRRREPLRRLLLSLATQLDRQPELADALDVVVVVDGSTDGSSEMVRGLPFPVPLRALWQPNRGLAAARNAGLAAASGELVWFLDDDLLLGDGLLARHRRAHDHGPPRLVMGPCVIPSGAPTVDFIRRFYEGQHALLAETGEVRRFDHFSAANTSGPVSLFLAVGGFEERFVGYGVEDYEIGYRLVRAGTPIAFDPEAVALHPQLRSIRQLCATKVDEGRNLVRMVQLHPETFDEVFPVTTPGGAARFYRNRGWRSPLAYRAFAPVAAVVADVEARLGRGRRKRWFYRALLGSTIAGAVELDVDRRCVDRLLGVVDGDQPGTQ